MLFDITTYAKHFENFGNNLADRWDPVLFVFIFMLSTKTTKIFLIFIDIQNIPIITIINKAHFKSVNRLHCAAIVSRGDWLRKPANKNKWKQRCRSFMLEAS